MLEQEGAPPWSRSLRQGGDFDFMNTKRRPAVGLATVMPSGQLLTNASGGPLLTRFNRGFPVLQSAAEEIFRCILLFQDHWL